MIYKISAAWGHHEGSMLLWLSALTLFSVLFVCFTNKKHENIVETTSAIQALILVLYTAYTIFASNPFARIFPAPINGLGLNPVLQDIGLALHPPTLYLGYVGFSLAFSSAVAVLIRLSNFQNWVKITSPWVLLSWSFLTLGIGLGSWWAYRELGWGGFWFWDPVENASLMPWLAGTALLHVLRISSTQAVLQKWSLFFAILTFSLSMIGTFLVRSGIITSVHSFATDPTRGIYVLSILSFLVFSALLLFSLRANKYDANQPHKLSSQAAFILLNNIFLFTAVVIVFVGTLYPFALELFAGKQIAVGAPYYNKLFAPLVPVTLIAAVLGSRRPPSKPWDLTKTLYGIPKVVRELGRRREESERHVSFIHNESRILEVQGTQFLKSEGYIVLPLLLTAGLQLYFGYKFDIGVILTCLSLWLLTSMTMMWYKVRPKLSNPMMPMLIAHIGFALVIFGISLNASYKTQAIAELQPSETLKLGQYSLTLREMGYQRGDNYLSRFAILEAHKLGNIAMELRPETRLYPAEQQQTTESAILHRPLYDLYVVIGELQETGAIIVRAFYEPGVSFIWFGCLVMFFGGIFGLITKLRA